jgi:hypothetical protein
MPTDRRCSIAALERHGMINRSRVDLVKVAAAHDSADDCGAAPARQLRGQRTHRAQYPVHQNRFPLNWPVPEHCAVCGDARDAQAGAEFVGHLIGKPHGLLFRHTRELRGSSEPSVRLGAVSPHSLPDPSAVHAVADRIDHAGAITVRDDAGKGHRRPLPAKAFFRVARVDT